jgi:hypothetical protein
VNGENNENDREEKYNDLLKKYEILTKLRFVGDYHTLTSTYLTSNSILIATIALLVSRASDEYPFGHYISAGLSITGIFLCIQMAIAQGRFRAQIAYWTWRLREIEENPGWKGPQLFTDLITIREDKKPVEGKVKKQHEFTPNFAMRTHRRWWAKRMKNLPLMFWAIFLSFLLLSAFKSLEGHDVIFLVSIPPFILITYKILNILWKAAT